MIKNEYGHFINEGYCEEPARASCRVISFVNCSNKAKYRVTLNNDRVINVCGTHLRGYYKYDYYNDKYIKGEFVNLVSKVEDIKTGKIIYEK